MSRDCSQCDCASRVWNGRPDEWVCANHPDHAGQLTLVASGGGGAWDAGQRCRSFRFRPVTGGTPAQVGGDQIRYISLTGGLSAIVDAADYEWLSKYRWRITWANSGYVYSTMKGRQVLMHRLIMDPPVGMVVDHVNGSRWDNRRCNLRVCTQAQNLCNRPGLSHTSRFKGVYRNPRTGKWMATISINRRTIYIGTFSDEVQAAHAYDRKARELFGAFAYLNFPGPTCIVLLSGRICARSGVRGRITMRRHERHVSVAPIDCHNMPTPCVGMAPGTTPFDHRQAGACRCHSGSGARQWVLTRVTAWPSRTAMATGPPEGNFREGDGRRSCL